MKFLLRQLGLARPLDSLGKSEIVLKMARKLGLNAYLEIATPTTGNFYREVRRSGEIESRRLMYRTPCSYQDGQPVDYRTSGTDITTPLAELRRSGYRPDICLVDGWHGYAETARDIFAAFALLPEGGVMVVHDCLPPSQEVADPDFRPGEWCGETHRGFVDFLRATHGQAHFTVDTDYGCGVVIKRGTDRPDLDPFLARLWSGRASEEARRKAFAGWPGEEASPADALEFHQAHKHALLNIVSASHFLSAIER